MEDPLFKFGAAPVDIAEFLLRGNEENNENSSIDKHRISLIFLSQLTSKDIHYVNSARGLVTKWSNLMREACDKGKCSVVIRRSEEDALENMLAKQLREELHFKVTRKRKKWLISWRLF